MLSFITTEFIIAVSIAVVLIIILGALNILKKKRLKAFNKQQDDLERRELELKVAQLKADKVLADTEIAIKNLQHEAKEELNKYKLREMGTLEREIRDLRRRRTKEIEEEMSEFLKNKSAEIEGKIVNKQKELMEFEEELSDILYEMEIGQEEKIKKIKAKIDEMKSMEEAAIKARIRQYEDENYIEFHSMSIYEDEEVQINRLLDAVSGISGNKIVEAMNKLIFEYYYKNPLSDLTSRICHGKKISGIYKITDIETGRCYIGQSVDIASRWLTHCKRGSGVDAPTNNKLYPEMIKKRIYNFTFEIVEVTEKLNEQEKYWTEYFGAKVFGYTMKA